MATLKKKPAAKKIVKKTAVKKTVAAKKAPAKKAVVKKPVVKKTAVKKAVPKKPVAKKAVAKKTAVKKIVVKKVAAKKPVPQPATLDPSAPHGIPEQMRDAALKIMSERQAEDVVTVNLAGRSSVADYMIIASGRAARQVSAIADYLKEAFYKAGAKQVRIEGLSEANWVLIDAGDVIVHLFRPEVRSYYDLDAIWNSTKAVQR